MKHLTKLRKTQYAEGAKITLDNAKGLLEASEACSSVGRFGVANALIVLSAEELAKAAILKIKSVDNSLDISNLRKYFTDHYTKQKAISRLAETLISFDVDETTETPKTDSNDNPNVALIVVLAVLVYLYKKNSKDWDSNTSDRWMEEIKKSGFYVDFDESEKDWVSPKSVHDSQSFDMMHLNVKLTFGIIEQTLFKKVVNQQNLSEFLDLLQDENIITQEVRELG